MKEKQTLGQSAYWLPQQQVWADVRTKDSSAAAEAVTLSVVLTSFQHLRYTIGFNAIRWTTVELGGPSLAKSQL